MREAYRISLFPNEREPREMTDKIEGISERDVIDNSKNNAIESLRIEETADGKYKVRVSLAWKKGELYLETQRKQTRTWASLDRLINHIKNNYSSIPLITIKLRKCNEKTIE